jgi:hypothetical protein
MQEFSPNVIQLIASTSISNFFLINIKHSVPLLYTTLPYSVEVTEIGVFTFDNYIVQVDAPRLTSIVSKASYKISLADPNYNFKSLAENGLVGTEVDLYIGFINTLSTPLGGANPGEPLLLLEDLPLVYSGQIDSHGYSISEDTGIIFFIDLASPMAALGAVKSVLTSKAETRARLSTDSACDQIYAGSRATNLLWGKP